MKKGIVFAIVLTLGLTGCIRIIKSAPEATLPPVEVPDTAEPTIEPPTATPDPIIFREDFEGGMDADWEWIRENASEWNLTNAPGWLEMEAGAGHVSNSNIENLLVRPIPAGDFELETKIKFIPVTNYQFAGLLVYEDDANFIQFGRAYCVNDPLCIGDGFYLDNTIKGDFIIGDNFSTPAPDTDMMYLRLRRKGEIFSAFYSEDGNDWQPVGTQSSGMNARYVGLLAGQSTYSYQLAQFDHFVIKTVP